MSELWIVVKNCYYISILIFFNIEFMFNTHDYPPEKVIYDYDKPVFILFNIWSGKKQTQRNCLK